MNKILYILPERTMVRFFSLALAAMLLLAGNFAYAAPKSELIPFWNKSDEINKTKIDHRAWGAFLKRYAAAYKDGVNRVNYQAVNLADKRALDAYIKSLEAIAIRSYSANEQFAYWVNLYNATTVQVILNHYPVKSITKVSFGLFSFGPWDEELLVVEQQRLSLNDIEHGILRPIWQDHRIHYLVNCASIGCPNMRLQPVDSTQLEETLVAAEAEYLNHPRGLELSEDAKSLRLSSIFDWYAVDFGNNQLDLVGKLFAARNANNQIDDDQRELYTEFLELRPSDRKIEYHYDWNLNQP